MADKEKEDSEIDIDSEIEELDDVLDDDEIDEVEEESSEEKYGGDDDATEDEERTLTVNDLQYIGGDMDEISICKSVYDEENRHEPVMDDEKITKINTGETRINFDKNKRHIYTIIVPEDERVTSDVISKFEYTELISIRASHIAKGSKLFIDVDDMKVILNPLSMAKEELRQRKCPLSIKRKVGDKIEIWDPNTMIIKF